MLVVTLLTFLLSQPSRMICLYYKSQARKAECSEYDIVPLRFLCPDTEHSFNTQQPTVHDPSPDHTEKDICDLNFTVSIE